MQYLRSVQKRYGHIGCVYDNQGVVVKESTTECGENTFFTKCNHFKYPHKLSLEEHKIDNTFADKDAVFLKQFYCHHGHKLTNSLCALIHLFDDRFASKPKIFTQWNKENPQKDFDELKYIMGYEKDDVFFHFGDSLLAAKVYHIPEEITNKILLGDEASYRKMAFVKDRMIERLETKSPLNHERVFAARDPFTMRVSQELNAEMMGYMRHTHGFVPVLMRKYSLYEQMAIMQNAKMVAGFSGSQLHNSLFCKPNTFVLNIGDTKRDSEFEAHSYAQRLFCDRTNYAEYVGTKNRTMTEIKKDIDNAIKKYGNFNNR